MSSPSDSPIEAYLDELVRELAGGPPRQLRHMLAESEAHLRDDAQAAIVEGVDPLQAEAAAVRRFGAARVLARAEAQRNRLPLRLLLAQVVRETLLIGGIGACAVGLSGLLAGLIQLISGPRAVIDVAPGQVLSPTDCARWLAQSSGAATCRAAAVADWAAETVWYRVAVGLLGIAALLVWRRLRSRIHHTPSLVVARDTAATVAFLLAFVATLGLGVNAAMLGGGSGQWLSATPVALVGALVFGRRVVAAMRSMTPAVPSVS